MIKPLDRHDIPNIEVIEQTLEELSARTNVTGMDIRIKERMLDKCGSMVVLLNALRIDLGMTRHACTMHGTPLDHDDNCRECFESTPE